MKRELLSIGAMLVLIGCSSHGLRFKDTPEGNQSVASLDEAGSVHVSVLSIAPWNDVKAKMRPEIPIDTKTLHDQSIPTTVAMLDKYLDVLRLQAAVAPMTVKKTSSATTSTETGKDDVTKTETSTTTGPGEPRALAEVTSLPIGSKPAIEASSVGGINSSLAARAMASYVQDVHALNSEVDYAASRTGYDAYLMRIQVSVMPRRRHLGYDVYSNLSFFAYQGSNDEKNGALNARTPTDGMPYVVPLLSSDSIETAQRSQSIESLRELGIALDLVKGFGAAGFSANSQKDRQQALQGLDVNSVLTLGRLSDNSLRVRFGAANDPGGGYATHPRTNTISVLVFFPKNANLGRIVSRSSWNHVVDGTELHSNGESYEQRLEPVVRQWRRLGLQAKDLQAIDDNALEGDYKSFAGRLDKHLSTVCRNSTSVKDEEILNACESGKHVLTEPGYETEKERTFAYVWTHLLSLLPGGRFSTTVVDLPKTRPLCPIGTQLVAYTETESGISLALRGGQDLGVGGLNAAVHWGEVETTGTPMAPDSKNKKTRLSYTTLKDEQKTFPLRPAYGLLASEVSVKDDRRTVILTFDSRKMAPLTSTKKADLVPLMVELTGCPASQMPATPGWNYSWVWPDSQKYRLVAKIPKDEKDASKEKDVDVALSASTDNLLVDAKNGGSGKTSVVVDLGAKTDTSYALKFAGGDVSSAGPTDIVTRRSDGSYLMKSSGVVEVSFRNVISNQTIDVELRPIDEKGKLGSSVKKLTLNARAAKT